MNKVSSLSIFFPCYNEAKNLRVLLRQILKVIPYLIKDYEVLVIDDGSIDDTQAVVGEFAKIDSRIKLITHLQNLGYGAALKTGFKNATKEWVFFTDADLQFSIMELEKFLVLADTYQVIIGYRKKRSEGWRRKMNAWFLKIAAFLFFGLKYKDIDCAFKLVKKSTLNTIRLKSNGAMISTELLIKLKKNKFKIKEISVSHFRRKYGQSTGSNSDVLFRAFLELWILVFDVYRF